MGHRLEELDEGFVDVVSSGYEARPGHEAFGSLGVDYTVTLLRAGGTQDLYFATTPHLPGDGDGLTVHVQTYGGELDAPLAEGVFLSGTQDLWFFRAKVNHVPTTPLSDVPLLRAQYQRFALIGEPPDLGTEVAVRLSYASTVLPGQTAVTFGASAYTASEGGADATVAVELSAAPSAPVTIPLTPSRRGGATPADYSGVPPSVTFQAGQTRLTFTVTATDDSVDDDGESVRIGFGPLPAGVRASTASHRPPTRTVHIEDDDGVDHWNVWFGKEAYTAAEGGAAARVSIHLDAPVEATPLDVRLTLRYGGGATAADHGSIPAVVRFALGERTKAITVTATDDSADDDGESVALWFGNPPNGRVSIGDGPITATEGGSDATVRVELDTAPGRSVTVPLTKANGGGATAADYSGIPANVTFGASQTARTFTVTATDDSVEDGGESVSIGFGPLPAGVSAGSPAAAAVTLADDSQLRSVVVNFGTSTSLVPRVREGVRFRFTLSLDRRPLRPVTIPLEVTHVGGATEADYEGLPASVTFGPNERQADFILRAVLDQQDEPGEGLRIDFGPLPPGVRKGTWGPYETVEFVDTDPAAATLSVSETVLTVDYPRALDGGSTPSPRDFVVLMAVPGDEAAIPVTAVTVDGDVVSLALARPVRPDDMVTLSYLMDAMHPTRDAAGLPVAPLTDEPVRNVTGASDPQAEIQLPDGTALAGLTGLRELDLSGNQIADLRPLTYLPALTRLNLMDNAVTDLWPLAELTSLQVLLLDRNQITDVQALSGLAGLANLGLAENQIANLWPLTGLDRLHRLDLSGNAVVDVSALGDVSGLVWLQLLGNPVSSAFLLGQIEQLRWLWLDAGTAAGM